MKTTLKMTAIAILALSSVSSFAQSTDESSSEEKVVKKHLKIIKIEDGVKTELDTVITGDDSAFFFHDGAGFEWKGDMPPMPDSLMMNRMRHFRFEGKPDGRGPGHQMREFRFTEGDSTRHMTIMCPGQGPGECLFNSPGAPMPPQRPMMMQMKRQRVENSANVIRLDSPDIISYQKKVLKDGTEKIEIIRKKPAQREVDVEVQVEETTKP